METVLIGVAVGTIILAIVIGIANKKRPAQHVQEPVGFGTMGVMGVKPKGSPPPMPAGKHQRNKRGWRAPPGHYFNDRNELMSDVGDLIIDMMIIAQLCGEQYSEEVAPAAESAASCCSEASASACSGTSPDVTSRSDSSSLQTDTSSYSGSDSYDSGGCDSGSGDCGGD